MAPGKPKIRNTGLTALEIQGRIWKYLSSIIANDTATVILMIQMQVFVVEGSTSFTHLIRRSLVSVFMGWQADSYPANVLNISGLTKYRPDFFAIFAESA